MEKIHDCNSCLTLQVKLLESNREIEKLRLELANARGTDPMTGLASKKAMYQSIEHHLALRRRQKSSDLSLIFFDLDGFKAVNDTDHLLGDNLIIEFADMLRLLVRECDVVARFGGDEFFVLAVDTDYDQAEKFVQKIQGVLKKYTSTHFTGYHFEVSVGIASTSEGFDETIELVSISDKRMLEEKRKKKLET